MVSAVGHETDFTIADFVADLRAPTPSAAAELVTQAQHKIAERVTELARRLDRAARFQLLQKRQQFSRVPLSRTEGRITAITHKMAQRLDELAFRAEAALRALIRLHSDRANYLSAAVLRFDPRQHLAQSRVRLGDLRARIDRAVERRMDGSRSRLAAADARLRTLSPLAVLERGYALVIDEQGGVVRSAAQLTAGDRVTTRLAAGAFTSRVETTKNGAAESRPVKRKAKP